MRSVVLSLLCLCGWLTSVWGQAQSVPKSFEEGLASWYGAPYHGQRSASGEIYDQEQFTAAHRTLPFGAKVRVRRLDSQRSVVVRINDRGPFVESRIIDLSHAAAQRLGITRLGVAPVTVEVIEMPPIESRAINSIDLTAWRSPTRVLAADRAMTR